MSNYKKLIEHNPIFATLPADKQAALLDSAVPRRYHKGEILACAGDVWGYFFLLTHGSVSAIKESSEGRSLVVTTFRPGDVFWGLAFFHDEMPMPATLRACNLTEILLWSRDTLLPCLQQNGRMSWELARLMIHKMTRASEILEEITFQPVAGRLAKLLMELAPGESAGTATRNLTLEEMAARIGTTREMVCRFLHRFADDGIIDITRTEFRVTDAQRLTRLAQNSKG